MSSGFASGLDHYTFARAEGEGIQIFSTTEIIHPYVDNLFYLNLKVKNIYTSTYISVLLPYGNKNMLLSYLCTTNIIQNKLYMLYML